MSQAAQAGGLGAAGLPGAAGSGWGRSGEALRGASGRDRPVVAGRGDAAAGGLGRVGADEGVGVRSAVDPDDGIQSADGAEPVCGAESIDRRVRGGVVAEAVQHRWVGAESAGSIGPDAAYAKMQ